MRRLVAKTPTIGRTSLMFRLAALCLPGRLRRHPAADPAQDTELWQGTWTATGLRWPAISTSSPARKARIVRWCRHSHGLQPDHQGRLVLSLLPAKNFGLVNALEVTDESK